jgi:hypothetical protein
MVAEHCPFPEPPEPPLGVQASAEASCAESPGEVGEQPQSTPAWRRQDETVDRAELFPDDDNDMKQESGPPPPFTHASALLTAALHAQSEAHVANAPEQPRDAHVQHELNAASGASADKTFGPHAFPGGGALGGPPALAEPDGGTGLAGLIVFTGGRELSGG